jgi:hypothetical protein
MITVLYYTANVVNEVFAKNVRRQLRAAAGDLPIVSVSQKPIDFGENICVGDIGRSHINIYRQVLIAAKCAQTPYVALCEDDILYTPKHFTDYLPVDDTFSYNLNRWRIYTWSKYFSYTGRMVLSQLIAPRKLLIAALQERFEKYPDESMIPDLSYFCEPGRRERLLGVKLQKKVNYESSGPPNIVFTHPESIGFDYMGEKKSHGPHKQIRLPYWGTVEDVMQKFYLTKMKG